MKVVLIGISVLLAIWMYLLLIQNSRESRKEEQRELFKKLSGKVKSETAADITKRQR